MGVMGLSSVTPSVGGVGSAFDSVMFTDHSPEGGKLGAVVLWRRKRIRTEAHFRRSWVRKLIGLLLVRTYLLPLLWRKGFEAWIHGSFKNAAAREADLTRGNPSGRRWSSASGAGSDMIGFDERLRVVGFRGRIFGPPPEGQAILLMLEDDDATSEGIRIIERSFQVPVVPDPSPMDPTLPKSDRIKILLSRRRSQMVAWSTAMHADPEYRRFMGE